MMLRALAGPILDYFRFADHRAGARFGLRVLRQHCTAAEESH